MEVEVEIGVSRAISWMEQWIRCNVGRYVRTRRNEVLCVQGNARVLMQALAAVPALRYVRAILGRTR